MGDSNPQMPFGNALVTAVRGLWGQPPLLAAVAIAIVLATVAVAAENAARTIAIPLFAVLVVGLVAWVYTDAQRARHGKPGVFQSTRFGPLSRQKDLSIKTGDVDEGSRGRVEQEFEAGAGSTQEGVRIEHGEVRSRRR